MLAACCPAGRPQRRHRTHQGLFAGRREHPLHWKTTAKPNHLGLPCRQRDLPICLIAAELQTLSCSMRCILRW